MNALRWRALFVLLLCTAGFGLSKAWTPTQRLADSSAKIELQQIFPERFGEWKTDERIPVQLVSPDVQARLNQLYNQTISRTYINARGDRIMLSVAYGGDQSDGTRAHLPEVCYPAQGFAVEKATDGRVAAGSRQLPVRRLLARQGSRVEPITYWLVVGEHVALSGTQMKLAQLRYSSRGVIPDGMLVRVSSISNDTNAAYELQAGFIGQLASALDPRAASRVLGSASTS